MKNEFNRNIWAICIIVLGVLLFLKYIGILNFTIFFDGWWTLIFIVPALIDIFQKRTLSEKLTDGVIIASGLLVLADQRNLFPENVNVWMAVGALIVIRVGIGMAMKDEDNHKVIEVSAKVARKPYKGPVGKKDDSIEVEKTENKEDVKEDKEEIKEDTKDSSEDKKEE